MSLAGMLAAAAALPVGLVTPREYWFLPPICLAIALVSAASHREDLRDILRHGLRAWLLLMAGIVIFMFAITGLVHWLLP